MFRAERKGCQNFAWSWTSRPTASGFVPSSTAKGRRYPSMPSTPNATEAPYTAILRMGTSQAMTGAIIPPVL